MLSDDEPVMVVVPSDAGVSVSACSDRRRNALSRSLGRLLPRFDARRKMPLAARADSENRAGAVALRMSLRVEREDEHPSSSLRHSEVASVENSVGPPVPEFPQRTDERPKIAAVIRGEESRYVFEEDGGRSVSLHKPKEGEGEDAALPGEACSLASD